jgi:membrane-bound inhibitor of C-type lysozyme
MNSSPSLAATILAGILLLSACVTPPGRPVSDRYARYRCAGGEEIGVTYQGGGTRALLERSGNSSLLRGAASGSGARYSDGKTVLHTRGEAATVEVDGKVVLRDCVEAAKPRRGY